MDRVHFDPSQLSRKTTAAAAYSSSDSEDDDGDFPRKRRRIDSKDRAALGIFGSDSEDDDPRRKWKAKTLRGKEVSFVSKTTRDEEDEDQPMGDEYDENEADADGDEDDDIGVGLGFGMPRGVGFAPGRSEDEEDEDDESMRPAFGFTKTKFDGTNPLGRGFVPSSAIQPVLSENAREEASSTSKISHPPPPASRSKGGSMPSFGARLLAKMGYKEGQGLGKEGQGRTSVIQANIRQAGTGLGSAKEMSEQERKEQKRQKKLRGELVSDSEEEDKKRKRERARVATSSGFSSGSSTPRRQKTKYMTANEVQASSTSSTPLRILDMTGRVPQHITSSPAGVVAIPPVRANEAPGVKEARRSIQQTQTEILALRQELKDLEISATRKALAGDAAKQEQSAMEQRTANLASVQLLKTELAPILGREAESWEDVVHCLKAADKYNTSYPKYDEIAVEAITPFIRAWDPLAEPALYAAELTELKGWFLRPRDDNEIATQYESMMNRHWFRQVNNALHKWDAQDHVPMTTLYEAWNEILPEFVRDKLIEAIFRKLVEAVEAWDPNNKKDIGLYLWIFPWLEHLPEAYHEHHLNPKGDGIVSKVRRRLIKVINKWKFENGVMPDVKEWQPLLRSQWRPLLMTVIQAMVHDLQARFEVDPEDQERTLPLLEGALQWHEQGYLSSDKMAEVLLAGVFSPKWQRTLEEWLESNSASLDEMSNWFAWWWRVVMPEPIVKQPQIGKELEKGMALLEIARP